MRRLGAVLVGAAPVLAGCVYYNSIYNAEQVFDEAERHRRAGLDSVAAARYTDVVRKAAAGYRRDPDGEWAHEALFLLGRAQLRLGELIAARAALEQATVLAGDAASRARALVYLGIVAYASGEVETAAQLVDEALEGPLDDGPLAEAHLLRGRLALGARDAETGWWHLDRAAEAEVSVRLEAGWERLRAAVAQRDVGRTEAALERLLADPAAGERADTVLVLVRAAARRWKSDVVAGLLERAGASSWNPAARGRLALERAHMLHEVGDTAGATRQALEVAAGVGETAAEARLVLARWRLAPARDLSEAYAVRAILLPAADDPRVSTLLRDLDALEAYTSLGLERPLGWFAAAELARDRLEAPYLARGFFLAYADGASADPWAAKALLAAIDVSESAADRAWLRDRLEAHRASPYVRAASGAQAAGFEALEEELDVRLREITGR